MKKKILYWSPFISNVGTVKSTLNSAIAYSRYSLRSNDVGIINVCGEWDEYEDEIKKNNLNLIKLNFSYFKYLPKNGYIQSRISFFLIFILSFFPLIKLLNKQKPDYLIIHLITSLPLLVNYFLKPKSKVILRISGLPKLNFLRKIFWMITTKNIFKITCPSIELINDLKNKNFLIEKKLIFLPDAIINIKKFVELKYKKIEKKTDRKFLLSVGRLTSQKNFKYLIYEISNFFESNQNYDLYIIGEGEQKKELQNLINKKKLNDRVYLIDYTANVYSYMKNASIYILSSLWEDPGFVIIEAALCNLPIISSNCSNGPKEFLLNGDAGKLFENNKKGALSKALEDHTENFLKKVNAKKNSLKYTNFRHYKKLNSIIS